jgi:hypothetical protein
MFGAATAAVRGFTFPMVVGIRRWDHVVGSGVGTFVVLNDEGWIITANHIFDQGRQMDGDAPNVAAVRDAVARLDADATLQPRYRASQIKNEMNKAKGEWLTNITYWWAAPGIDIKDTVYLPEADLAIGRLDPFPKEMCRSYPVFKNPAGGLPIATSLCRLGFPFREVKVTYDEAADQFGIPEGGLAYFPIEGILTRMFDSGVPNGSKYHVRWIETSSPGLRGQSGGPIYDVQGRIWGIQSRTDTLPLGFAPEIKVGGKPTVEHQFISLGIGSHPATLVEILTDLGIRFAVSPE